MKKFVITKMFMITAFVGFSQTTITVGDTIFYANNRAIERTTSTFVIIKESNVGNNKNAYKVDKYFLDVETNKYLLNSEFITNGLQVLKANGPFVSYYKNGKKASEGIARNGRRGEDLWTFYYRDGMKRSEEKLSTEKNFGSQAEDLTINFWNEKGEQTVKKGNGFVNFKDKDGLFLKGNFKGGLKNGLWTAFDGKIKKYEETYKKGVLLDGKSWNEKGETFKYEELFSRAFFKNKGSRKVVMKYLDKNFYSDVDNTSGRVSLSCLITKEGLVSDVKIKKGLTDAYNTEIKRVLSGMKGWSPAKKRGQSFDSRYILNLDY
jgi:hypothetical protein